MQPNIFARVILLERGDIHIVFVNKQSYRCHSNGLEALLTDPGPFLAYGVKIYPNTTGIVNPTGLAVESVPGVTLAVVYEDMTNRCLFPDLYSALASAKTRDDPDPPLDLKALFDAKTISNERQFLLRFYLEFFQRIGGSLQFTSHGILSASNISDTLLEMVNLFFFKMTRQNPKSIGDDDLGANQFAQALVTHEPIPQQGVESPSPSSDVPAVIVSPDTSRIVTENNIPPHYVTAKKYAELKKVCKPTVYTWCRENKLASAVQDEQHHWYIDPDDSAVDRRSSGCHAERKTTPMENRNILKDTSYAAVQEWMEKKNHFSPETCRFIRTKEEFLYYKKRNYREYEFDGIRALLPDIYPEYRVEALDTDNRALIRAGKAPYVPDRSGRKYDLHHVGQQEDSVLAAIPDSDHSELSSVFHQGNVSNKDLHNEEFEKKKYKLWNAFVDEYDKYGSYRKIPCIMPPKRYKKRGENREQI